MYVKMERDRERERGISCYYYHLSLSVFQIKKKSNRKKEREKWGKIEREGDKQGGNREFETHGPFPPLFPLSFFLSLVVVVVVVFLEPPLDFSINSLSLSLFHRERESAQLSHYWSPLSHVQVSRFSPSVLPFPPSPPQCLCL